MKKTHVLFDDLNDRLMNARALTGAIRDQDEDCQIEYKTVYRLANLLTEEIEKARVTLGQIWNKQPSNVA